MVPGNHDVNNFIGRLLPRSWKLRNYSKSRFPLFSLSPERLNRYFEDFNLAVFGFDSTLTSTNIAEGEVSRESLSLLNQQYNRLISDENRHCYKLAVVHHHPLPIPHTSPDNFLLLRRAGDFLKELMLREVDIILYGHKHEQFFSRVRYRVDDKDYEVVCIGAGSATQRLGAQTKVNSYNVLSFDGSLVSLEIREARDASFRRKELFNVFAPAEMEESVFNATARALGFRHGKIIVKLTIRKDGTQQVTIGVRDLEIIGDWTREFERRHAWGIDEGVIEDVRFVNMTEQRFHDVVEHERLLDQGQSKLYRGVVKTRSSPPPGMKLAYDIEVIQRGAFALTKEELSDRLRRVPEMQGVGAWPLESLTEMISVPIDVLHMEVEIFPGYEFRPEFGVFSAGKQEPEIQRTLRDCFSINRATNIAQLVLRRPRIGYAYAIGWAPMAQADLERLFHS